VLIDEKGRVKLTDFGLAKRVDTESTQLTQTHFAVGTPHYMAPEQLEQPKEIDHRVDIYSMGVLFYEMLTRELPIGPVPPAQQQGGRRRAARRHRLPLPRQGSGAAVPDRRPAQRRDPLRDRQVVRGGDRDARRPSGAGGPPENRQ
jgi:serine/threonine protein kinase